MAIERKVEGAVETVATEGQVKLTVAKNLGVINLEKINIKQNSNGTPFIATPQGAVYAKVNDITPGLYRVVELSNGALALNDANAEDKVAYLSEMKTKFPNCSFGDLKEMFGL